VAETDEALVRRLARGDTGALEELYVRYARPVYSLALRILGDTADAEETTQDVFERVWRHAPSFDAERGRFGTWLMSMTHHVAVDRVRRRSRRPQSVDAEVGERITQALPDARQDVSDVTLRNLDAQTVRTALRSLPEPQKQAIELAFFGGMSHLEIAAVLGDPLGTVKARIRRGMERLRGALAALGVEEEL